MFSGADSPEAALNWTRVRWADWFGKATYIYFGQSNLARKRSAFGPFQVEPLSEVAPAVQLNSEIRRYAPDVVDYFLHAVEQQVDRWRADDGQEAGDFILHLYDLLGSLTEAAVWEQRMVTFVSRLGPPLSAKTSLRLLDAVVRATVGRSDVGVLRRVGEAISRRTPILGERPWRAQIRLFEGLLEIDGDRDFADNVRATLPDIIRIVNHTPAKHLLADVIVERLGLRGVVKLYERVGEGSEETEWLAAVKVAVFPGRVAFWGDDAVDNLTKERLYWPAKQPKAAFFAKSALFDFARG